MFLTNPVVQWVEDAKPYHKVNMTQDDRCVYTIQQELDEQYLCSIDGVIENS